MTKAKSMGLLAGAMTISAVMEQERSFEITNPYSGLDDLTVYKSRGMVGPRSTITKSQRKKRTSKNKQAKKLRRRNRK